MADEPDLQILADRIRQFLAVWGEREAGRRRTMLAESCVEDLSYVDPFAETVDRDGVERAVVAMQAQIPLTAVRLTSNVDAHHQTARYAWVAVAAGERALLSGMTTVLFDRALMLTDVWSFFGPLQPFVYSFREDDAGLGDQRTTGITMKES